MSEGSHNPHPIPPGSIPPHSTQLPPWPQQDLHPLSLHWIPCKHQMSGRLCLPFPNVVWISCICSSTSGCLQGANCTFRSSPPKWTVLGSWNLIHIPRPGIKSSKLSNLLKWEGLRSIPSCQSIVTVYVVRQI